MERGWTGLDINLQKCLGFSIFIKIKKSDSTGSASLINNGNSTSYTLHFLALFRIFKKVNSKSVLNFIWLILMPTLNVKLFLAQYHKLKHMFIQ